MKLKTILIIFGSLLSVFMLIRGCVSFIKSKMNYSLAETEATVSKKKFSFTNTDFTTGEYAIVLDDKKPPILIDEAVVLEANKDKIETDVSWLSYLPGEGGGAYGLRLFKNGKLIEERISRKFSTFKVGKLREHGKPMEFKSIYEPRTVYEQKKDSLEERADIFISSETEVSPEGYEYRFILECPSLLVSEQDSTFNDFEYGKAFAQRIKGGLSEFSGFKMGDNASNRMEKSPMLVLKKDGFTHYIRNDETDRTLSLDGYKLQGAQLIFFCTKTFYEQVQTHDFSTAFKREGLIEQEIKTLMREKMGPDTKEVKLDEVYTSMFTTAFEISDLFEQKYELRYFELMNDLKTE